MQVEFHEWPACQLCESCAHSAKIDDANVTGSVCFEDVKDFTGNDCEKYVEREPEVDDDESGS